VQAFEIEENNPSQLHSIHASFPTMDDFDSSGDEFEEYKPTNGDQEAFEEEEALRLEREEAAALASGVDRSKFQCRMVLVPNRGRITREKAF